MQKGHTLQTRVYLTYISRLEEYHSLCVLFFSRPPLVNLIGSSIYPMSSFFSCRRVVSECVIAHPSILPHIYLSNLWGCLEKFSWPP